MSAAMDRARPRVLMVGTSLGGRGGIAAVVDVLRGDGWFERECIVYVATHVEGGKLVKLACALRGLATAARTCLIARPAIVHVHSSSHASFLRKSLVLWLARRSGALTIFHLHGGGFRRYAGEAAGPLLRRWIRHTLEASSCVIALSPGWAGVVHEFAPRARPEVLPNPVRLAAAPRRAEVGRILFLGRIAPAKGVDELLQACARLAPQHPALQLVLAGEGEQGWARRRAAELGIAGRVELPGWLAASEREAQLARAWLFCLPSHAEGLPMAMLEAMAAGVPVVASRVGAIPDLVTDGVEGLLAAPGDVDALVRAIGRLLADRALHTRLACAARGCIETHCSLEVVCGRLGALYAQLMDEGKPNMRNDR